MKIPELTADEMQMLCDVIERAPGASRPAATPTQVQFFQWPWVKNKAFKSAMGKIKAEFKPELEALLAKMTAANDGGKDG